MDVTASQNPRITITAYLLTLSTTPREGLERERWEETVDRLLGAIGLEMHQSLIVARPGTEDERVVVLINRVHPRHSKAARLYPFRASGDKALAELEAEWASGS